LEQLENFQKKLWLKKKFVVETNYCITLDSIPKEFHKEIFENKEQLAEWKKLGFIAKKDHANANRGSKRGVPPGGMEPGGRGRGPMADRIAFPCATVARPF
jgi:hypothetical protein